MFSSLVVVVAFMALVSGKEFTIDEKSVDSVIVGIGSPDSSHLVSGSSNTNSGAEPSFWASGEWSRNSLASGLVLDVAASSGNKVAVAATFSKIEVSNDKGATWTPVPQVVGLSQSVDNFDGDSFAVAGQFASRDGGFSGVAVSTDGAASEWNLYPVDGATSMRYGAYPSANTWFLTEGLWDTNTTAQASSLRAFENLVEDEREMSSFLSLGSRRSRHTHMKTVHDDSASGWFGNIWKTTDAGKTFTKVYSTADTDMWYFNQISCSSESNCVAVGEGQSADGTSLTVALMTSDGGATWTKQEFSTYASLMACKMVSDTEVWIAPLEAGRGKFQTDFLHSTDGGKTYTSAQSLTNCYSTDVEADPSGALVASTCLNAAGTSSTVAFYQ